MINTLLNHRTIRKYKEKNIDNDLLVEILNAGIRASTTGNMQVYSIINTKSDDLKSKLAPAHFNQKMITQAPVVLTFCADFNRFNKWCIQNGAIPGYDNFLSFITAAIDALLVAQNVAIAAESKGLGICYLGTTIYNADTIIELLELPKGVVPITTITVGWPNENVDLVDRLPLEAIVHQEKYCDYTSADISTYYQTKENLPQNLKFVEENRKPSLAHVFTDIRYKKVDNEFFSEKIFNVLKGQGFL